MILGIGTDIVEVARIKKAASRLRFVDKCFTDGEMAHCIAKKTSKYQSMAGLFAAKEAVAKAIGSGFRGFLPRDIEIIHDEKGAPRVKLSKHILLPGGSNSGGETKIMLSISHEKHYATAIALLVLAG